MVYIYFDAMLSHSKVDNFIVLLIELFHNEIGIHWNVVVFYIFVILPLVGHFDNVKF